MKRLFSLLENIEKTLKKFNSKKNAIMCAKLDEYNPFTMSYITIIKKNNNVLIGIFRICNLLMAILNKRKKSWLNTDHDDVPRVNSFQPSNDQLCNTPSLQGLRPPSPKKFDI